MVWEKERVDRLLELNKKSYSASQIAQKLGCGATRNAVIGKLNRMGLSCGGGRPEARETLAATNKAKNSPKDKPGGTTMRPVLARVPVLKPAEIDIGIADLSDSTCRFPMGDPENEDFRFCGAKKIMDALPYCDHHNQLAHQRSNRAMAKADLVKVEEQKQKRKTG